MQALVAANGEVVMTEGAETGVQDIRLRLIIFLGTLFYDVDFGALIHNWIKEENILSARMGFEAEVKRRIEMDPRVVLGTTDCKIESWDETGITANVSWKFIDEDHPYNLVIEVNSDKMEIVIKDVNTG